MVFRLFEPSTDRLNPVDRLICETHIIDTISIFDFDHEERDERSGSLIVLVRCVWN